MSIAYGSWGANSPAYPELVVTLPDGSSSPWTRESGVHLVVRSTTNLRAPDHPSLIKSIELGEQLVRLLEAAGEFNPTRRGPKTNSIRALADRMHRVVPPSSMWRAIAIYRMAQEHPELASYRHLGVGHLSVLLSLRGPLRLGLLRKAEAERWSRRRLQSLARQIKQAPGKDWVLECGLGEYLAPRFY